MNILEQTEALKDLPDQALIQQMQMPTGEIAPIFITSELKRRKRMRDDYARREAADTPTVAEEVVMAAGMPQGGIADAARAMAPKSSIAQNTGMNEMMPRTATQAPQRMAEGGIVGMRQGGKLVKVMGANFYAFSDGEVYVENPDGSREAVTDPRVLGVIRQQANVGPERQEDTASLGSEIMADASPQTPGLESAISSDRPFSPLSTEVIDTRPATPSDLGMGGERPSTLTTATQPAINQEQALLDAMSPAFDRFGGDPLTRAIRDQQEQGIASLNPPSAPAIEATPDGPSKMEQMMQARSLAENQGGPMGEAAAALAAMEATPYNPMVSGDPRVTMGEVMRGKLPMAEGVIPAAAPSNAERDFDPLAPLGQERAARAVLAQQAGLEALRNTQPNVDVGTDPRFGDTMGLQEVLAGDFDPVSAALSAPAVDKESNIQKAVSELGLKPITRDGEEYFISPAGMVFKPEEGNLVPVAGGEAMQAMDVAQRQGEDFSASPAGQFGTYAVDPETGVVDPSKFTPFSGGDISGAKTPQFITDALGPGSTVSDFLNVQEGAAPVTKVDETKTRVAPASPAEDVVGFGTQPGYDDYPMPAPITMGEKEAVGVESLRPKARPQGVAPVADTTTPTTPDAGGITTVSTKAINDAAKSTGLGADAWLAIAQGGAAMAASKNPTLLGAFGEGMGVAAAGLQKQRAAEKTANLAQAKIDATLQAAQIRAAAAGQRGTAPPTGSALLTYLSGQLDQANFARQQAEASKGEGRAAEIVRLDREIADLQARIAALSPVLAASVGGTGSQAKNIDVSKG